MSFLKKFNKIYLIERCSFRNDHITEVNSFKEFEEVIESKGGFVSAHWDGTIETENKIKELTKATIRCIPYKGKEELGSLYFYRRKYH